jgi:hypothetical protein
VRRQFGVLTYRETKKAVLKILLVNSRETCRWVIPKGWPIKSITMLGTLRMPRSLACRA